MPPLRRRKERTSLHAVRPEILWAAVSLAALVLATIYAAIVSFRPEAPAPRGSWFFPVATGGWTRRSIGMVSLLALLGLAGWIGLGMRQATRPASRYLIPDGYVGWVRVEYGVNGAPALPVEDGRVVLRFPADARLQTSSPERFGWAKDEFFYVRDGGLRPLAQTGTAGGGSIWGRLNGEAMTVTGKRQYEEFFVGSETQFRQAVDLKQDAPHPQPH